MPILRKWINRLLCDFAYELATGPQSTFHVSNNNETLYEFRRWRVYAQYYVVGNDYSSIEFWVRGRRIAFEEHTT